MYSSTCQKYPNIEFFKKRTDAKKDQSIFLRTMKLHCSSRGKLPHLQSQLSPRELVMSNTCQLGVQDLFPKYLKETNKQKIRIQSHFAMMKSQSIASPSTVNFAHVLAVFLIYVKQTKNMPGYEKNVNYYIPFTVKCSLTYRAQQERKLSLLFFILQTCKLLFNSEMLYVKLISMKVH